MVCQCIEDYLCCFEQIGMYVFDFCYVQDFISVNVLVMLVEWGVIWGYVCIVYYFDQFDDLQLYVWQECGYCMVDCVLCVSCIWQDILQCEYGVCVELVFNGVDMLCYLFWLDLCDQVVWCLQGLIGKLLLLVVGGVELCKNMLGILQVFVCLCCVYLQV